MLGLLKLISTSLGVDELDLLFMSESPLVGAGEGLIFAPLPNSGVRPKPGVNGKGSKVSGLGKSLSFGGCPRRPTMEQQANHHVHALHPHLTQLEIEWQLSHDNLRSKYF